MIDFSKMEGHTPGPWVRDYGMTMGHIKSTGNEDHYTPTVCHYDGLHELRHKSPEMCEKILPMSEVDANAHLIAAAPAMKDEILRQRAVIDELVEAIEGLTGDLTYLTEGNFYDLPRAIREYATTAIKKAKGE